MKMLISIVVGACLFISTLLFAHGGDKPGPHGGKIEMPGPYHVEAVRKDLKTFEVYLLDIEFANPITKNSEVKARILADKNISLSCTVESEIFYRCKTETKLKKSVVLIIESNRNGVEGNEAKFEFK